MDTKKGKITPEERKEKNRLRMAKYRKSLKSDDEELFLEKQRLTKAAYRAKTKPQKIDVKNEKELTKYIKNEVSKLKKQDIPDYEAKKIIIEKIEAEKVHVEGNEKIDELISKMSTVNLIKKAGPRIDTATLVKYGKAIKRLYESMSNQTFDGDLSFLHNIEAVSEFIDKNYKTVGNKLNYFKSIVGFLKRLSGFEDLSKEYSVFVRTFKNMYDEDKGQNQLSEREEKNFVPWTEILKYPTKDLNEEDSALVNLYRFIPPRRLLDYKVLTYVKNKTKEQIDKLDKDFNYITINKVNHPTSIVFNNYKTKKRYRTFTIDLTQADKPPFFNFSGLRTSITKFIKSTKFEDGDLFFPNTAGKVYGDFSRRVQFAFRLIKGKEVSSNVLRHSFISYYSKKQLSTNTIKLLAKYLGHSVSEFLEYRKFEDEEEDE